MLLADYLILILQSYSHTLKQIAFYIGEDQLVFLLENQSAPEYFFDVQGGYLTPHPYRIKKQETTKRLPSNLYAYLESSVHEMKLQPQLEFYIWAYPPYRTWIESESDLSFWINPSHPEVEKLANEPAFYNKRWIESLDCQNDVKIRIEHLTKNVWLKFRTEVLKSIGKNPFIALSPLKI